MTVKSFTLILSLLLLTSCAQEKSGIRVVGTWGGTELQTFEKIASAAGVKIRFETTRDLDALLSARLGSKNLPDMAILPNPARLRDLAKRGHILPLDFLNSAELSQNYAASWLELGSYAGNLYGLFLKTANKSLIWYNPKVFKKNGWTVPKTWQELLGLTKKIRDSGLTPWSIGADIGWPLSDWIENILVRTAGPDFYNQWAGHAVPWTHPSVIKAFQTWDAIVGNPKNLAGGIDGTLASGFQNAAYALFRNPPTAALHFEGDFINAIVRSQMPDVEPLTDIDFFLFPAIDPALGTPIVIGGDAVVVFRKTPETEKLLAFLASREANIIAAENGFLSQHRAVPLSAYPDPLNRKAAKLLAGEGPFVFDASDIMPPAVGNQGGFWDACKTFLAKAKDLDTILQDMEELASRND